RSYYDALQVSVRRSSGALRFAANYTYSKSIDTITAEGNGYTAPIDSFNIALNRARGDFDHRHSFNASTVYTLPFGNGKLIGGNMPKWLDTLVGGWDIGSLFILQDGIPFTISSQRTTREIGNGTTALLNTWVNYSGDRNIGGIHYQPDGSVFYFTPEEIAKFSFPAAGTIGNSGRNAFRGPRFFNVDMSLVKKFRLTERHALTFRAEAYNLLNNPNFNVPLTNSAANTNFNLTNTATFSKLSQT